MSKWVCRRSPRVTRGKGHRSRIIPIFVWCCNKGGYGQLVIQKLRIVVRGISGSVQTSPCTCASFAAAIVLVMASQAHAAFPLDHSSGSSLRDGVYTVGHREDLTSSDLKVRAELAGTAI